MPKLAALVLMLTTVSSATFAQIGREGEPATSIHTLNEVVVRDRPLKTFRHTMRPLANAHYLFRPEQDATHRSMDSAFSLVEIPRLSPGTVRLRFVNLHLAPWDTAHMQLKLIVLQLWNGDTSYIVQPLKMNVRRNWARVALEGKGLALQPGAFYVGYSFSAFNLEDTIQYRVFQRHVDEPHNARIKGGRLELFVPGFFASDFQLRLEYEEI